MAEKEFISGVDQIVDEALLDQEITAAKVAQAHEENGKLIHESQRDEKPKSGTDLCNCSWSWVVPATLRAPKFSPL